MKALIFNSGLGKRMGNLTLNNPKSMIKLSNGETIFERQIRILSECGISEFVVTTGPFKEQLIEASKMFSGLRFTFVENPEYEKTNYIVSMNNASEYICEDILMLHGDLVFNKRLVERLLQDAHESVCLYNECQSLPLKDFKGRFENGILKEVSINIFDTNCYAFQPMYKLSKAAITMWKNKVAEYVSKGIVDVYAENALNEVADSLNIYGISYKDDYISEIDNEEDYKIVSDRIRYY